MITLGYVVQAVLLLTVLCVLWSLVRDGAEEFMRRCIGFFRKKPIGLATKLLTASNAWRVKP